MGVECVLPYLITIYGMCTLFVNKQIINSDDDETVHKMRGKKNKAYFYHHGHMFAGRIVYMHQPLKQENLEKHGYSQS